MPHRPSFSDTPCPGAATELFYARTSGSGSADPTRPIVPSRTPGRRFCDAYQPVDAIPDAVTRNSRQTGDSEHETGKKSGLLTAWSRDEHPTSTQVAIGPSTTAAVRPLESVDPSSHAGTRAADVLTHSQTAAQT